jgi:gas vesicle protein
MGYFRGVIHGMAVGTVIGLCIAPQEGARTRAQVQRAVQQARSGVQRAQSTARTVMPVAQTAVRTVAGAAGRMRHPHEEAEPYVSVDSTGNGKGTGG